MHIEGGRIYDSSLRKSMPLGMVKKTTDAKRAEIDAEVQQFLAQGKTITVAEPYTPKPKPVHKQPPKAAAKQEDETVRTKGRSAMGWPESVQLKDKMAAENITYRQLAEQAGVPRLTLARWIQRMQIPSNAWKTRMAEALQLLLMKNGKTPTPKTR